MTLTCVAVSAAAWDVLKGEISVVLGSKIAVVDSAATCLAVNEEIIDI